MGSFKTDSIHIGEAELSHVTQTTADLTLAPQTGDTKVKIQYSLFNNEAYENTTFFKYLLDDDTFGGKLSTKTDLSYWSVNTTPGWECVIASHTLELTFTLEEATTISFEWANKSTNAKCEPSITIDGAKKTYYISKSYITSADFRKTTLNLSAGTHTIIWDNGYYRSSLNTGYEGTNYIRNLSIPGLSKNLVLTKEIPYSANQPVQVSEKGLKPDAQYYAQFTILPDFTSQLPEEWIIPNTVNFQFKTLPVYAKEITPSKITQSTALISGKFDGGDATIKETGLQFKEESAKSWLSAPIESGTSDFSQRITRLRPNTKYLCRSYILAQDCDTVFSETADFTTLPVEALKPIAKRISQHEVTLEGKVRFGDAVIYQRGMQFRKVGVTDWEEVEDGGNDSIYMLVKKNLKMGQQYEARTYIQPAGCDVIYSDISSFKTYDRYFGDDHLSKATQTTLNLSVNLLTFDEDAVVEESGFQYVFIRDGFHRKTEQFVPSDTMRVSGVIKDGWLTASLYNLTPDYYVKYRAYLKINGEYIYSNKETENWKGGRTEDALLDVEVKELTQSSITLKLDATQNGDAVVSQLKYAFGNWLTEEEGLDLAEYQACGNELKLNNLKPDTQYYLYFSGTTNGRMHPLLVHYPDPQIDEYVKCYYFTTKPVSIQANFSNVTQTKATMKVNVDAGDATVSDLKYRLNSGEYKPCGETVNFEDLIPGITYTVSFTGKVNGNDVYWTHSYNSEKAYSFTTRRVSVSSNASDVNQTSAAISWSYDCGDATYVSSGIVYGKTTLMEETQTIDKDKGEKLITELLPTATYYYQVYVETKEGGRTYSTRRSFTTTAISCTTLSASSLSNRSATLNGTINCDDNSSAEFGFQWKQMEGWASEPAFTKGKKTEDGSISVALVNGMLEPNLDYQYRAAVRYKGVIYSDTKWQTFRTESEYVFYPANVYTMYRTDRENNRLVLCGYFVAGSEEVVSQGYEYWKSSSIRSNGLRAASNNVIQITTDESMTHSLDLKTLSDGNYSVRAFVKTSSGTTMYGETLIFGVKDGSLSGIEFVESDKVSYSISDHILNIYNASDMSCAIYNMQGQIVEFRQSMTDDEQFTLATGFVYIVKLSDGTTYKIII